MPKKNQIPGLCSKPLADGRTAWHWKPSARLRRLGWQNLALGTDFARATAQAIARNAEIEAWARRSGSSDPAATARPHRLTFGEAADLYLASAAFTDRKPKTQAEYKSWLRALVMWAEDGRTPLRHIDRAMVLTLRNTLVRDGRRHRTAAILRVLALFLKWCENEQHIALNPATKIDIPEPPRRRHRITVDQLAPLLAAARGLGFGHVELAVVLGFTTMQREGDLLATTAFRFRAIDDLSADARRALAGPDGRVLALWLEQGKTGAHVAVPLIPRARQQVEAAIEAARGRGSNDSRLIQKNGRACHEKTLQRDFRAVANAAADAAAKAGDADLEAAMRGLQFRDLRRSGMCWLRENLVPVAMIASVSGHSIDKTSKILDTYMPRDTRSAAEGMAIAVTRQAERDAADAREADGA